MNGDMPPNRIREANAAGRKAVGFLMNFPSPCIVELLGRQGGFDFAYADGEHGAFDLRDLEEHCRACDLVGLTPIARIPEISRGTVGRFLDRGMRGIIAPHVDTAADARRLVEYCRFHPEGSRSYGAGRAEGLGVGVDLERHCRHWNANVLVGVMIESQTAIDNLDALLAVDGIDCFMIGANDFAQGLGYPGQPAHPAAIAAAAEVAARVRAAGKSMREDVMRSIWMRDLLLDAAAGFVAQG
ncbi:MAG: aldolase/citrate lyase family protein [Geminicoccaceae bacterium]|jgi:4-hydroxy-2-oxoheptanedioate aldolase|nr:hypothetical protein [Geminicoccaceae bacterium]HRY26118.1 aldolase/citrate lyase family protein [Geminicoccaceae bacterium]